MKPSPSAFDAIAPEYDREFSETSLGRILRRRVWERMETCFQAGDHLLELACGTGQDALWLARRGIRVTAVDGSPEMIRIVNERRRQEGHSQSIKSAVLSHQQFIAGAGIDEHQPTLYSGALSNFGGLNTISEWRSLARRLGEVVAPGGSLLLVVMGPFCPWEIGWHLAFMQPGKAFRRMRRPARAHVGGEEIPVWYPSAGRLRRDFEPWFHHRGTESLGLGLPPSYLAGLVDRWPRFFERLDRLERRIGRRTFGWGDHFILTLERKRE